MDMYVDVEEASMGKDVKITSMSAAPDHVRTKDNVLMATIDLPAGAVQDIEVDFVVLI